MNFRIFLIPKKWSILIWCHSLSSSQQHFVLLGAPIPEFPTPLPIRTAIILFRKFPNWLYFSQEIPVFLRPLQPSHFMGQVWRFLLSICPLGTVPYILSITHSRAADSTVEVKVILLHDRGQTVLVAWPWLQSACSSLRRTPTSCLSPSSVL